MLVSTAMLSLIVLGLTAMFVQTQKAFKSGIKQSDSTDAGRAIIDMIASDMSQMANPGFTNVPLPNGSILASTPTNQYWQWVGGLGFYQTNTGPNGLSTWSNQISDVYVLVQTNNVWTGVGYVVSNWLTGSGATIPGICTLYRCTNFATGPLPPNNQLYSNFVSFQNGLQGGYFTNCHPIANGVVDLKIVAYDAQGNENTNQLMYPSNAVTYPVVVNNSSNNTYPFITNYLPHSVDIELGILEPEAFEHVRALYTAGATTAAANYLAGCAGQVQIFRQHILIPAAP